MKYIFLFAILLTSYFTQAQHPHHCSQYKSTQKEHQKKTRHTLKDQILMNQYDVSCYKFNLQVERDTNYIVGDVTIVSKVVAPKIDTIVFELVPQLIIDSIKNNSILVPYTRMGDYVYVTPGNSLNQHSILNTQIFYHGHGQRTLVGAYNNGMVWRRSEFYFPNGVNYTQGEPFYASYWFPCKQVLEDKVDSVEMKITTDKINRVASNGILISNNLISANKIQYVWKTKYPMAYYLISIAVSDYKHEVSYAFPEELNGDSIAVDLFYNDYLLNNGFLTSKDSVSKYLERLSNKIGLYPFYKEKYGHSLVPYVGGMENQTMTTLGYNIFNPSIIVHEMAHHWFGNNVTCKTWHDVFINEGITTYLEYYFMQNDINGWSPLFDDVKSEPDGSIYCPDTVNFSRIFDSRLSYYKGACVMRTLSFEIGEDTLFMAFKNFQNKYAGGTATIDDFKKVVESTSRKDMTTFFNQWIYGEGYPTYSIRYRQSDTDLIIKLSQIPTKPSSVAFFNTPLEIKCRFQGGFDTLLSIINLEHDQYIQIKTTQKLKPFGNFFIEPNLKVLASLNDKAILDTTLVMPEIIDSTLHPAIFPNPTSSMVKIRDYKDYKYTLVYNMLGKMILKTESDQINLTGLPNGIYLFKIFAENKSIVQKIVLHK